MVFKMSFTSMTWITAPESPPLASMPSLAPSKYDWTRRRRSRSKPVHQRSSQQSSSSSSLSSSLSFKTVSSSHLLLAFIISLVYSIGFVAQCTDALLLEPSLSAVGGGGGGSVAPINDDNLSFNNMENKIAAIFSRVSYGSTTTKRSISDTGSQSSLTTIPTPFLTTYRYRENEKDSNGNKKPELHKHYQQINSHHRNFEEILERDHGLPTSAPNADILKTHSNPVYPNPNRHHNHERHHGSGGGGGNVGAAPAGAIGGVNGPAAGVASAGNGPTPAPGSPGGSHRSPTVPMLPGDMPSYSPPSRAFFTPPLPREFSNPFADKPTLRGTNSDPTVVNSNQFVNRRVKPPPNVPPVQRIPLRPPDLAGGSPNQQQGNVRNSSLPVVDTVDDTLQRRKTLNTPQKGKNEFGIPIDPSDPTGLMNGSDPLASSRVVHIPSISRILSGSNGRKEDISDVILRTVTVIPNLMPSLSAQNTPPSREPLATTNSGQKKPDSDVDYDNSDVSKYSDDADEDGEEDSVFDKDSSEQGDVAQQGSTEATFRVPGMDSDGDEKVHNMANADRSLFTTTAHPHDRHSLKDRAKLSGLATWTVAWNIHVYLSAILFTILAVYSIFKMIFFDKLTHLFNQSYFICIHLILIIICLARIFYLCYDAYNTHSSFHLFISEILLNLPATFLTVAFAILILFLLIRTANHKNNRYSALMRPLTVVVASSVHVGLCITLHYVESYETINNYYHSNTAVNGGLVGSAANGGGNSQSSVNGGVSGGKYLVKGPNGIIYNSPPRILSLICQIIYIFVCLSLGFLYLYIYRMLKRILRNKSQNYIHGYQNLSYAIHITIATALLFILLAAVQIYGAIGLSLNKPIMTSPLDIDWLQWGYQFSLRLIEIAIITLLSWVTGLKTSTSKVLQREKRNDTHNVSGFALFPCTSSSSQEHFETDYPAVCNANTNLHSYTLRTGKPIYDDNFALNALNMEQGAVVPPSMMMPPDGAGPPLLNHHHHPMVNPERSISDFQLMNALPPNHPDHPSRASNNRGGELDSNSIVSSMHNSDKIMSVQEIEHSAIDYLGHGDNEQVPDHYENPNFELRGQNDVSSQSSDRASHNRLMIENGYAEPINAQPSVGGGPMHPQLQQYDFQNFERPSFDRPSSRNEFRASKNLKALKQQAGTVGYPHHDHGTYGFTPRGYNTNYNSFDRRNQGIKKSGTLGNMGGGGIAHHRGGRYDGNSNSSGEVVMPEQNGVGRSMRTAQTLNNSGRQKHGSRVNGNSSGNEWRTSSSSSNNRSSLERNNKHYNLSDDDYSVKKSVRENSGLLDPAQQSGSGTQGSSSGDSASSGSMLVAEHGFVRFKALDELNIAQQQQAQKYSRGSGRAGKERKLTNT